VITIRHGSAALGWHPDRRPHRLRAAYGGMDAIRWPSVLPMAILGWFVCLTILGV
jgi:hypothetical protein